MRRPIRAPRRPLALLALLGLLLAAMPVSAAAAPSDVIPNIQVVWARTDSPQARGDRPFVWGPQPVLPAFDEPLAGLPGDRRKVVYWDKARMEVATKGMPQTGRLGFELFDKPNWVGSEFDEKVNYQRALEGELEHTIETPDDAREAHVTGMEM